MSNLTIRPLSQALVLRAYALIQLQAPATTLVQWRGQARARLKDQARGRGGILTAQDADGYLLGMVEYERLPGPDDPVIVTRLIVPGVARQIADEIGQRLLAAVSRPGE